MAKPKSKKASIKDKIRKRAKEAQASKSTSLFNIDTNEDTFLKPAATVLFDVIPYEVTDPNHPEDLEVGDLWFRRPYKLHFLTINDKIKPYVCLRSIGQKCPICNYYTKMIKRGYSEDDLKPFKAKEKEVYNVIDVKNPKDGVKLFDMSPFLFGDLLNKDMADDLIFEEYGDFSDLKDGFSLRVRFDKTTAPGFTKAFLKASRIDYITRKKAYPENILKEAHNLDNILNVLSYDQLETILFNMDDETIEEYKESQEDPDVAEDEEDIDDSQWDTKKKVAEKKSSAKKSKKKKEEEVEDEEEEDDEDEQEEEIEDDDSDDEEEEEVEDKDDEDEEEENEDDEDEEEEEEDSPEGTCPNGYEFGVDCDTKDECDECPVWDACSDMKESLEKEKKKTEKKKKPAEKKTPAKKEPAKKATRGRKKK